MTDQPILEKSPPHIMIVESRYYNKIADQLLDGVTTAIKKRGGSFDIFQVSGAFELPAAISFAILQQEREDRHIYDGYIALGCVIRGETTHYDYVCAESARGLMDLAAGYGLSMGYGILTVENNAQAWERADIKGKNKGGAVANACLNMIELKDKFGLYPR